MNSLVLRSLNPIFLLLLFIVTLAIHSALFNFSLLRFLQPNITVAMVIWFALRRNFLEGGVLTLIIAEICEIHSATPQGFFLIQLMLVYLILRLADKYLVIPQTHGWAVLAAIVATGIQLLNLLSFYWMEIGSSPLLALVVRAPIAVGTTSLASYWIFKGLHKLDWVTFKSAQARAAADEELLIDSEGF